MTSKNAQPTGEITLRFCLDVARKRRGLITTISLLTILSVAFVTFFVMTPTYKSTAVVLVKLGREFVYNPELGDRKSLLGSMDGIVLAELEILHSEDLIRSVVETLNPYRLYPDLDSADVLHPMHMASSKFRESFSATSVSGSDVIRISFQHADPEIAAESVNLLVERFKEYHLKVFSEAQSTDFLKGKVIRFEEEMAESEEKLRVFQAKYPILTVDNAAQALEEQRAQLDVSLKQVRNQISALEGRREFLREKKGSLSPYSEPSLHEGLDREIVSVSGEIRAQEMHQQGLERQLAGAQANLQALPNHLRTYRTLLRERDANERSYAIYSKRFEEALISAEMDRKKIANISMIQKGRAPLNPTSPNKVLNLAVASIFGLGLGFVLALMREGFGYEEEDDEDELAELLLLEAGGAYGESDAEVREWEWVPLKASHGPSTYPGY
jgi:uncharacterized protein involved in exopolysaccharide biosynthesis